MTVEGDEQKDYDEVIQKFLDQLSPEQRMMGLSPEQRTAGLSLEQRLATLAPEQIIFLLPEDVLRGFSGDVLASLPAPVRDAIRKRTGC